MFVFSALSNKIDHQYRSNKSLVSEVCFKIMLSCLVFGSELFKSGNLQFLTIFLKMYL